MSTNKDFKRVVRTRMQKTGESYTAARASLLRRTTPTPAPAPDYSAKAGMSDAVIVKKTGKDWATWVDVLDRVNAHAWTHTEIAQHVALAHDVKPWWTQAVTVGYERIKGLRAIGQRRAGHWEASKSKTIAAPLDALSRAFSDARRRAKWLPGIKLTVRKVRAGKDARITWPDGSDVVMYFVAKGIAKSTITVQHTRLAERAAVDAMKAFWSERLEALALQLADGRAGKRAGSRQPTTRATTKRSRTALRS